MKLNLTIYLITCLIFCPVGIVGAKEVDEVSQNFDTRSQDQKEDKIDFTEGYALFEKEEYKKACLRFYRYLSTHTPDDTDYEWAEFFFGISLKKMGLSHASVDILSQLVTRKPNPKIVSYCLELFEKITRSLPFDRDLIIHQVICDESYGFVDQYLSDFINYHQGIYDWRNGFKKWGDEHFSSITPETYYYYKHLYHKALFQLYQNDIDESISILNNIQDNLKHHDEFKDQVRQTLARLLYEKGEFKGAALLYEQVETPILEQAENLLERAWGQYRMGQYEKAMGLLYAFKAPVFKNYFTPEYYILKSFIYKGVCHYEKALGVINEFKKHYGESLEMIYNREELNENRSLLLVIINKKRINDMWKFLELLEKEKASLIELSDPELREYLDILYTLEIEKISKEFKEQVQNVYEKMADDLLKYEEESHLLEYEIGLDMYQRVRDYHYREKSELPKEDTVKRTVAYPFQGEFWSYEMDDYQVTLPNKCECSEEWDVFFK